ncbi:hypothetical protein THAOC_19178 [Thalassiosira oceanica]|uniref:Uncharacterized protein n=1 Tax=Thalassiosira oceanica TaxID=159749 RepID=K0SHH6_THAOC|nr:hypothetical protein THAOC_19178 [Thalassiosira oceanica]|eukprot:EJK60466.1 hypothetical protein THAOC_19178 [Thalassiosira oceanica]
MRGVGISDFYHTSVVFLGKARYFSCSHGQYGQSGLHSGINLTSLVPLEIDTPVRRQTERVIKQSQEKRASSQQWGQWPVSAVERSEESRKVGRGTIRIGRSDRVKTVNDIHSQSRTLGPGFSALQKPTPLSRRPLLPGAWTSLPWYHKRLLVRGNWQVGCEAGEGGDHRGFRVLLWSPKTCKQRWRHGHGQLDAGDERPGLKGFRLECGLINAAVDQKIKDSGHVPILPSNVSAQSIRNYTALIADQGNISIAASVGKKNQTRYASENGIRGSVSNLALVGATHFIAAEKENCDVLRELSGQPYETRRLTEMVNESLGYPVQPIRPELLFSTDDTTEYIFVGAKNGKPKFVLASKASVH